MTQEMPGVFENHRHPVHPEKEGSCQEASGGNRDEAGRMIAEPLELVLKSYVLFHRADMQNKDSGKQESRNSKTEETEECAFLS